MNEWRHPESATTHLDGRDSRSAFNPTKQDQKECLILRRLRTERALRQTTRARNATELL